MGVCIAVMFVVVIATAVAVGPDWGAVLRGLFRPSVPQIDGEGIAWTIALMGGVGGTVTVLCYGYWIREEGREGAEDLAVCRIDLAVGYAMTAVFGIAMVIIGSTIEIGKEGSAKLMVHLADKLAGTLGSGAKWAFLGGAWGAIFSSLLGVWQSVPYLFADFWTLRRERHAATAHRAVDTRSRPYRLYLLALATIPAVGLWATFEFAQKLYAIVGALFIPMLAMVLLALCTRSKLVGRPYRNSPITTALLLAVLAFFLFAGWLAISG
jgi:Mn2+/Fe2+ NRAMP family transporter